MWLPTRRILIVTSAVLWLLNSGRASAAAPAIQDNAGLFTPEAIAKAEWALDQLKLHYQVDVHIETLPSVPADTRKQLVGARSAKERDQVIARWIEDKAQRAGTEGIYVLLCKDQAYPQSRVVVGPETQAKTFTRGDGEKLRKLLAHQLDGGHKQNDQTLIEAVNFVEHTVAHNLHGWDWAWVLWVAGGVLVVWLGVGLLRTVLEAPAPDQPAAIGIGAGARDGSLPGLLGGMAGAAAGQWLWACLLGGERNTSTGTAFDAAVQTGERPFISENDPALFLTGDASGESEFSENNGRTDTREGIP